VKPLDGQLALVTGASRGIGLAIARALDTLGAKLILVARRLEGLSAAAGELEGTAFLVPCDLTDRGFAEKAIADIRARIGAPAILVNNAGIFPLATVENTSVDDFEKALQANLLAPFVFVRAFLGDMKARGTGHVVTIGSIADRVIYPGNSAYAATKFGARAMHEVLRAELKGTGVRSTLVSPGPVNTDIWNPVDPDNTPGFTRRADMLSPDAVAAAVEFALTRPADVNIDELRLSRS
jgi:NADP-dependent 3-hydroxy acid dehydrogenase YdfG